MSRRPEFPDLVGDDVPAAEADRLRRVHDLLVAAGPPPEVTAALARPPEPPTVRLLPRRRRGALLLLAATLGAAAFGIGYVSGGRDGGFDAERTVLMRGTAAAPNAFASIDLGSKDAAGNWPMLMRVRGLEAQPPGGYYNVYLTRGGKPIAPCGSFRVQGETTEVRLNAPYRLKRFDGWIVTKQPPGVHQPGRVVLTTERAAA